jgi:hypothetical protein
MLRLSFNGSEHSAPLLPTTVETQLPLVEEDPQSASALPHTTSSAALALALVVGVYSMRSDVFPGPAPRSKLHLNMHDGQRRPGRMLLSLDEDMGERNFGNGWEQIMVCAALVAVSNRNVAWCGCGSGSVNMQIAVARL